MSRNVDGLLDSICLFWFDKHEWTNSHIYIRKGPFVLLTYHVISDAGENSIINAVALPAYILRK